MGDSQIIIQRALVLVYGWMVYNNGKSLLICCRGESVSESGHVALYR